MGYIVFARKYRPQTFDDIEGQPHITTTLKNAISQDRVAHAYIFAGPRGVGKTTTARIFAKALSCERGPTTSPCNNCDPCREITHGSSLDCLEIDGASNRGIDEIRALRENVKFAPSKARLKIYIIDEVHMLTAEAFNALLKTLEEPPPHAKFIFATTHAGKIPATILSRCQRFDFRRIAAAGVFKNLKKISESENLKISDDALMVMARHCDGSIRDAQVALDQIMSFAEGPVGAEDVAKVLGVVEDEVLFGLSRAISDKDVHAALRIVEGFMNEGKEPIEVVTGLIEHFRNIAIAKIGKELDSLIDATGEKIRAYAEEAKRFTIEEILYIIYTLSNTIDFIRKAGLSRIPFETSLIKLTRTSHMVPVSEMIDRLEALEKGHATRTANDTRPAQVQVPAAAPTETVVPQAREDKGELIEITGSWDRIVNHVKTKKMSIGSYLEEGYPMSLDGRALVIGFSKEVQFHKEVLDSPENRRLIEEAVRIVLNLDLKAKLILTEAPASQGPSRGSNSAAGAEADDIDPIVKTALDIFGGEMRGSRETGSAQR